MLAVQGEGRGHMTQALAFQQWCRRNGHQVVRVLAGRNPSRNWPDFFSHGFDVPVEPIASPGFSYHAGRRVDLLGTLWQACRRSRSFLSSLDTLDRIYAAEEPDLLVNFLEPLAGLHHRLRRRQVPQLAIGHQFMAAHPSYPSGPGTQAGRTGMRLFSSLVAGRGLCHALSFFRADDADRGRLRVAPPLLRDEVTQLTPEAGTYLLVYLLNAGYRSEVERWHRRHPTIPIRCFYERPAEAGDEIVDATLSFHPLHGERFLRMMAGCRGVVCSAGFESIAEAACLGKPVLAVPVEGHREQQLNAIDAFRCGLAVAATRFDLERMPAAPNLSALSRFQSWMRESEARLAASVQAAFTHSPGRVNRSSAAERG